MISAPKAYAYARASTDKQELSPEVQVDRCRRRWTDMYATADAPPWGEAFVDAATSGTIRFADREGGSRLLGIIRPGDMILVDKADRIGRSTVDILLTLDILKDAKARVVILDYFGREIDFSDPMGVFLLQLGAAQAQYERALISKRTKEALAYRKANNMPYTRGTPFGFAKVTMKDRYGNLCIRPNGKPAYIFVDSPEERQLIATLYDRNMAGEGRRKLAIWASGFKTTRRWTYEVVRSALRWEHANRLGKNPPPPRADESPDIPASRFRREDVLADTTPPTALEYCPMVGSQLIPPRFELPSIPLDGE